MAQPNLDEIKEVGVLLDKIDQYKKMLTASKVQLENDKNYLKNQEIVEKQKIRDDIIQKKALEQLQAQIEEYRAKEQKQKQDWYQQFSTEFENFISNPLYKSIVLDVIKKIESEEYTIIYDKAYFSLIPEKSSSKIGNSGDFRIVTDTKEYILDPEYIKKIVFDKLLVTVDINN
jgi:hypothetical protein